MRPPVPPPPPPKRQSVQSDADSAVSSDNAAKSGDSPLRERPAAPPPPPRKRDSVTATPINDDTSALSDITSKSTNVVKRPPRKSEIKTIPVEKALESLLREENQFDDIEAKSHTESQNPFGSNTYPTQDDNHGLRADSSGSSNPPNSCSPNSSGKESTVPLTKNYDPETPTLQSIYGNNHNNNRTVVIKRGQLLEGEPHSLIYHKNTFSEVWFFLFLLSHTIQFILLLDAANAQLSSAALAVIIVLAVAVIILTIFARWKTRKSRLSSAKNVRLKNGVCTPDDEADEIADTAIYCLAAVCVLEGISYAIFAAVVAGRSSDLNTGGYYTLDTILQILRFASITLLALHRIIRPANRIDPLRTILELEVVAICWDAIDGSTVFELLDGSDIGGSIATAARALMVFWYLSVGVRMALMFLTHLTPTAHLYSMVVTYPLQLSPQPTVDRTLQALRLRAIIIMTMAGADIYAAVIRTTLWARGELNALQQEMALKNFLFLMACSNAYYMYTLKYPKREVQLVMLRWAFVVSYMAISISLSVILFNTSVDSDKWTANIVIDAILALIFVAYCRNVHIKADIHEPKWFFIPRDRFFGFPFKLALFLAVAMAISLLGARIPGIYYSYSDMADSGVLWTYNNSLLLISLSVIPIGLYSLYWSVGYMLFRKEFTAVPGNYNAIHDPAIQMMATAAMTEGALDVLSCATLMQLAENNLSSNVNGAIVFFCILEVFNACQSMAFQVTLSGGHDDTPLDLVRWNAYLRIIRVLIDAGAIFLRVVLWIQYNAVSSVFLVKNIYNLIHTISQIERWKSVGRYPKETLFSQFVAPQEWYGLTNEQWRKATNETIAAQARSGRRV